MGGKKRSGSGKGKTIARAPLPDPKIATGPYRPFANDPGWTEAWWWFALPVAVALFVVVSYRTAPAWHRTWVTRESGILETAQFIFMVMGLAIAVQLCLDPFVRKRPFVLTVAAIAAIACLFIAGEEVSWGQHIFFWQDPELVTATNNEGELSLHNMNKGFESAPRAALEFGVMLGGLAVPALCALRPGLRQSRLALFLPSAALVPMALLALMFKFDTSFAKYFGESHTAARSSEGVEFYLYFFMFAYLAIFERRIGALETENATTKG